MTYTENEYKVLNTKSAMDLIILEAKKALSVKFKTPLSMVNLAISVKDEKVLNMMNKLVMTGITTASKLIK